MEIPREGKGEEAWGSPLWVGRQEGEGINQVGKKIRISGKGAKGERGWGWGKGDPVCMCVCM